MLSEEAKVRELVRQMHERAEHAPWALSAEDIRSQRQRRTPQTPNPKILGLVAAVIILILVAVLVGTNLGSGAHKSHRVAVPPTSTTTTRPTTTTTTNGAPRMTMPELVGESRAQAESSLENLGLTAGPIDLAPSANTVGTVIAQAPSAGSFIAPGSEVTITVSSGP